MSEAPSEPEGRLPTFVVSLHKHSLLIPRSAVAEIIPYEPLQRVQDTPDWFLGFLGWRGIEAPVVSFEILTMERASFSLASVSSASLVVIRALGGSEDLSYFALVAQTPPRLCQIGADELFEVDEPPARTELLRVRYQNEVVSIPDLDFIEEQIKRISWG